MKKEIANNPFQIKQSKNNLPIPIVNGVHLHSSYDPVKEAKKMISKILMT